MADLTEEELRSRGSRIMTAKQREEFRDIDPNRYDGVSDLKDIPLGYALECVMYRLECTETEMQGMSRGDRWYKELSEDCSRCRAFIRKHRNKKGIRTDLYGIDNTK